MVRFRSERAEATLQMVPAARDGRAVKLEFVVYTTTEHLELTDDLRRDITNVMIARGFSFANEGPTRG